jgi:predicted transcriptional regulator
MAMSTNGRMATKKPQVTVYVTDEVNAALDLVAVDQRRSRSQMAALLIEESLKARGYLSSKPDEEFKDSDET